MFIGNYIDLNASINALSQPVKNSSLNFFNQYHNDKNDADLYVWEISIPVLDKQF